MALNVDILSVNELYINGVNILENKRDYIELVGDEKIIIDVPSTTYTKTVPQTGVNLGDLELKTTPLDGKTFDSINNAGGVVIDGVSYEVDSIGAYVQDVNIDTFTIGQSSALKTIDFTTYKWSDVDFGVYSLILNGESLTEIVDKGLDYKGGLIQDDKPMIDTSIKKFGNSSINMKNGTTGKKYIKIPTTDALSLFTTTGDYTDYTIEFSVYFNSINNLVFFDDVVDVGGYSLEYNNNVLLFRFVGASTPQLSAPYTFNTSTWYHIAIVYIVQSKTMVIYINGTEITRASGSRISGVAYPHSNSLYIGTMGGGWYNDTALNGYIDEFIVSKGIARYTNNFNPPSEPHTIDSYTTIYINGEYNIYNVVESLRVEESSFKFNGSSYITAPSNPKYALGLEDFTIEFNTKVTTIDPINGATLLENTPYNSSPTSNWRVAMTNSGRIVFQNGTDVLFGTSDQLNKWCNVVVSRTNGIVYLFVNGIKEDESLTMVNFTRDTFDVGRNSTWSSNGAYLRGFIDDLRITKGICRYTENFTPSSTPDTGVRAVKSKVHNGTVIASDIEYADYTVNYGTVLDPWVAVEPTITTSGEPFTLIDATVTSINTFTTTETIQIGDIVSADRETFGTVVLSDNGEYMIDTDIFFDGTTEKDLDVSDVNIINFVQDTRASSYANGLRDALLATVNKTIYGHTYNDIIIDAGLGGHFVLGTLYTTGGLNDSDKTTQFQIQLSDDGIEYTTVYENLEDLTSNHAHLMVGTGRFIKIVFLDELDGWGRINTNIVNGKWWNLKIVHPLSTIYKYNVRLSINGNLIVPKYIQWFDNMTINKIVCGKVFINPTTVLKIDSENVAKVELDLWQEVKGVY